ncbi:MAG: sialidase family protein [Actinomycetota bacterium]
MRARARIPSLRTSAVVAAMIVAASTLALPTTPTPASTAPGITFGAPVKLPSTSAHDAALAAAGEPGIKVDSAGTIYATTVCCLLPAETFYSSDGGKTFQTMDSPGGSRQNSIGAEGDFAVDDADRVIFADTAVADIRVSRWRDHGATWERTVDASEENPINDRPWLGWGQGTLYMYTNGVTGQKVHVSYDEGLTWNPVEIGNFSGFPYSLTANRQDGAVWMVSAANLQANVLPAGSTTWNTNTVAAPARGSLSGPFGAVVATDEAGNGYVVYSTSNNTGCDLYVSASTDHGQSWGLPMRVNANPGCATFPWIDAGDPGHIVVAWYQSDTKKSQNAMPATATWQLHTAISTDFLSGTPSFTETTLPNVTIDTGPLNRDVWDFFQVAIGPDGRFNLVYSEDTSGGCPEPVTSAYGTCKHAWYVGQAGGPLLHANRLAPATSVTVDAASAAGGTLSVSGSSTFKAAPSATSFSGTSATTLIGGSIKPVGPDSGELLFTLSTPPNGTPGFDGLPGSRYGWGIKVDDVPTTSA